MKLHYFAATSAACLLLALPALAVEMPQAQPQATAPAATAPAPILPNEPVLLQPTPLPPSSEQTQAPPLAPTQETRYYEPRATLGAEGMMFTMQRQGVAVPTDEAVAAIAPAAGGAVAAPVVNNNIGKPARTIGGAQVVPAKALSENVAGPRNLSTLERAINTAELDSTLATPGPYTLFAPSNNAFAKLPQASFNNLLSPAQRPKLTKLLNYHIVTGQHDAASIRADIAANGGTVSYPTLAGENVTVKATRNGAITLTDANGNTSRVALADAYQSNGVMHIVDTVLIPQ